MAMKQNTVEWLQWRKEGITSSDAPVIMGESPYNTILKLYQEKTDPNQPTEKDKWIYQKGHESEVKARAELAIDENIDWPPRLVFMADAPYLRCSLDGDNGQGEIAEFKMVGEKDFASVKKGIIRKDHYWQIMFQLMVSGAKVCHYVVRCKNKNHVEKVYPDKAAMKKLLRACQDFWFKHVQAHLPPEASDKDYVLLRVAGITPKLNKWKTIKKKLKALEAEKKAIEEWVKPLVTHPRMTACGINFLVVTRQGSIDYVGIPELQGVDLEKYRKPGTEYIKME